EVRCLLSADHAEAVIQIDAQGNEWCELPAVDEAEIAADEANTIAGGTNSGGGAPFDYGNTFLLHSNPTAKHTIYLDFDGHTTSGTQWNTSFNGGSSFTTPAYNPDNTAGFSNTELTNIQKIWQRVAEDFIAFNVDVTTEAPASGDLINSGGADQRWGIRVVIGGSCNDWYNSSAGGVAYLTSFRASSDVPCFVFPAQLGNGNEKYVAEAVSHEVGHTLGLQHDGTSSVGYYDGHGTGVTAWAPIMGVGYYVNLSQWSKGEYSGANNHEDDLAIILGNGFGYRADDYGNTICTAGAANTLVDVIDGAGVIERESDVDYFSFETGTGNISLTVNPFELGPNLDILASLYDSVGQLVATSNPAASLAASLNVAVTAGTYYLRVGGTGNGSVSATGYSAYGSIGQYSFSGTIVSGDGSPSISVSDATITEGGRLAFVVSLSKASASDVTVNWATAAGSASSPADFLSKSGTLKFSAGQTTKTIYIDTVDDLAYEGTETLNFTLSNGVGAVVADGSATGTISDNDSPPSLSINDVSMTEGKIMTSGKDKGKPQRKTMVFTVTLSSPVTQTVKVKYATKNGTAKTSDKDYLSASGTLEFAPGETSKTISVTVLGDKKSEAHETFTVTLSRAVGVKISDSTGVGTIRNDDGKTKTTKAKRGAVVGGELDDYENVEVTVPSQLQSRTSWTGFAGQNRIEDEVQWSTTADESTLEIAVDSNDAT
ncbi:MAG: hypothetical protein KDA85_16880, partial [Planctomycetaceae bacterium]|nr:hypothetical protein [Planctomycetaceae bacterium]